MTAGSTRSPPRIVLGGDPLDDLLALLVSVKRESSSVMRIVLKIIIDEGRKFAGTPEGRPIARRLVRSRLFKNGKVLWTMAGVDEFLAKAGVDNGVVLPQLQNILDAIRHGSIEDFLMRFLEEHAEQQDLRTRTASDR